MAETCSHVHLKFVEKYVCTSEVPLREDGYGYMEDTLQAWADNFVSQGFWFECELCGQRFLALEAGKTGVFRPGFSVTLR